MNLSSGRSLQCEDRQRYLQLLRLSSPGLKNKSRWPEEVLHSACIAEVDEWQKLEALEDSASSNLQKIRPLSSEPQGVNMYDVRTDAPS